MAAAEIVAIGTELLIGDTLDTNGAWLGRAFGAVGLPIVRRTVVGDDREAIRDAVNGALARTGVVLCTGGLGPTRDDLTKPVVAELFGRALHIDADWLEEVRSRFRERGREMPAASEGQALVPDGATLLPNPVGTAPGLVLEDARGLVVLLPGVPHELRTLTETAVVPFLRSRSLSFDHPILSRRLRTTGLPESAVADRIDDLVDAFAPLTVAFLPSAEGVDLRLTSWSLPEAEAEVQFDRAEAALRERLGDAVYGSGDADLATGVGQLLRERGLTLAVAESCTGGWIAKRLTDGAGASGFLLASYVTYANNAKRDALGVSQAVIDAHGAVSEAVVRAMAKGARTAAHADCALAVTGIAGPDGGTAEKPVGTVWIGAVVPGREESRLLRLRGDRNEVRARSVQFSLALLRELLLAGAD